MIPRGERKETSTKSNNRPYKGWLITIRIVVLSCLVTLLILVQQQVNAPREAMVSVSQAVTTPTPSATISESAIAAEEGLASENENWRQEAQPVFKAIREQAELEGKESTYYTDIQTANKAMSSEWTLLPDTVAPGDVVLVRHKQAGEVKWLDKTYTLQSFGAGYFTYLPIGINTKAGKYSIGDQTLTIQNKKFETQYIKVTKQMASMRQETDRIQADQKKINLARGKSSPEFLFTTDFIQPIEGILTTPYGYTRYVNDKLDSRHTAIDLAADEGTPIHATNDGVVALADNLYLTGNSIYIDHGMHLFSQYAHMSKLLVKAGDQVKQGDIIGLVGSTGFSTGPHLHFTFWAHNVPVNPNLFFKTTPFHWLKKADDHNGG